MSSFHALLRDCSVTPTTADGLFAAVNHGTSAAPRAGLHGRRGAAASRYIDWRFRLLVASPNVRDLLLCVKQLSSEANRTGDRARTRDAQRRGPREEKISGPARSLG